MADVKKITSSMKSNRLVYWAVGIVLLVAGVMIFGNSSPESVFKDMNNKMLMTKSVTIDSEFAMEGTAEIKSRLYVDLNTQDKLLAKGNFSLDMVSDGMPMTVAGDLIRVSDGDYIRYSNFSSSDKRASASFSSIESKLKNSWIKVRDNDQFGSFASMPLGFVSNILPTPFANLNDSQRKNVLAILQDESMYTVDESAKVDTAGVAAYKYSISYNKSQYQKMTKALSGYSSYFKSDDSSDSSITSYDVWVDINTKQIIKIEYSGTTDSGDVTGKIVFSDYNKTQRVEKPSDYSIESELLN